MDLLHLETAMEGHQRFTSSAPGPGCITAVWNDEFKIKVYLRVYNKKLGIRKI